jgi:hypothetical protein
VLRIGSEKFTVMELARVPRNILIWTLPMLKTTACPSEIRRLALVSSNGGLPVDLLDLITSLSLTSENFERHGIRFVIPQSIRDYVETNSAVAYCIKNISSFTDWFSSEATLRSLIWDPIIGLFLLEDQNALPPPPFKFNFGQSLNSGTRRRTDIAVIQTDLGLPILIVEVGKDNSILGEAHKDFSKLLCLMTASCQRLCAKMQATGKDPRIARVYGLWIGNTSFHCVIAHPKFVNNQEFLRTDVSIHLSFPDHWKFNLISSAIHLIECTSACCVSNEILSGNLDDSGILTALNSNATVLEHEFEIIPFQQAENPEQTVELFEEGASRASIDLNSFCKLKIFLNLVRETSLSIAESHDGGFNDLFPNPITVSNRTFLPSAISNGSLTTPKEKRVRVYEEEDDDDDDEEDFVPNSPSERIRRTHSIVKRASFEVEFYKLIQKSKSSIYFPRLFSCDSIEEGKYYQFTFEKMEPLIDSQAGYFNSSIIQSGKVLDLLLESVVYSIHVLFQLHIMHEEFGVVHCDVSIDNVMYSSFGDVWKLMGFDMSLPLEQSLKQPRIAGTPEFVCPESLSSGIFTFESDVYALGEVLFRVWYIELIFMSELSNASPSVDAAIEEFKRSILFEMYRPDPAQRISVSCALNRCYAFLLKHKHPRFIVKGERSIMEVVGTLFENVEKQNETDVPMQIIKIS